MNLFKKRDKDDITGNKYYMFKNQHRKNRLHGYNKTLKSISSLAFFGTAIGMIWLIIGLMGWLVWTAITFGAGYKAALKFMADTVPTGITIAGIALLVWVIAFVTRFILEWLTFGAEMKDLNKQPEENAKYISVGKAVIKSILSDMTYTLIALSLLALAAFLAYDFGGLKTSTTNTTAIIFAVVVAICALIVFAFGKKARKKIYAEVHKEILAIRDEREVIKQEKIEAKTAAKKDKKAVKDK